jgi:DNA processing protein
VSTADDSQSIESARQQAIESSLRLQLVQGVGPRIYADLIDRFGDAHSVLSATPEQLRSVPGVGTKLMHSIVNAPSQTDVASVMADCQSNGIEVLDRNHRSYPKMLAQIYDPPSILFYKGTIEPVDQLSIAIVGTRHSSNYGDTIARKLAHGLSMAGLTIVSGLARGIDAQAHKAALAAGGRTLAVLGGGILKMYPPEHETLAAEIASCGAVISEALPLQAPQAGCFPRRNRIVTGLSLGVVVVEAGDRSGAAISARLAMEQGREVFAVPGRIDSRNSSGCHQLIRDGATLVRSVDDVLEQLGPLSTPVVVRKRAEQGDQSEQIIKHPAELKLSDQETAILQCIGQQPTAFDDIMHQTGLPASRVLSTISVLEVRRLIRRLSSTSFVRV